ncbi:MAG: sporulation protein YunB [Ruminococcus flavefaciens]|nr:sporulation protein YunB [Ruminococcus flavefaciens]MCM1229699.1 sporulation protein YunB [Ruminococcus flavefaciens]
MKRHRRRKHKIRPLIVTVLLAVIILLIVVLFRTEKAVRPVAEMQSEQIARQTANRIITETVSDYIAENNYTYSDFANIICDTDGRAVSVEAIPVNINRVQSELTAEINRRLSDNGSISAEIAVGSLSGSYLLAGRGPVVDVRICPAGEAEVSLKSSFDSAGVNQTRHRIYAEISANLISSIPLYSFETEESFEFLIAETVIVGDVPDYAVKAWSS